MQVTGAAIDEVESLTILLVRHPAAFWPIWKPRAASMLQERPASVYGSPRDTQTGRDRLFLTDKFRTSRKTRRLRAANETSTQLLSLISTL